MGLRKGYLLGMISAFCILGCAGMSYRYYGLTDVVYDHGTLLGPKEKDDLPFSKCAPNSASKNPCVVMFKEEFFALKLDYEDTKKKLIQCEKKAQSL